ncbi:hypothetical protein VPAG_00054 [Vibrio phage douglas 12A4]|uniref:hypothetical protein n=1 Tax=Vibrio phage douglas 12A4 TaxID=573171 RepID=UPI0002C0B5A6|nr:hypothetical protein VPAG_00054 [Vibrio phage douglas 12A4]AGG58090.1 hypothetical protein VPAG_00054 [Vibrio phage douglas 12A4]
MINLKFRGKCIKTGNWVYGGGIDSQRDTPIIINHGERYAVDAESVGMFTGISDYGSKMYEGDIYQVESFGVCTVVIEPYYGVCFDVNQGGQLTLSNAIQLGLECKKIGNTTDNKDMVN